MTEESNHPTAAPERFNPLYAVALLLHQQGDREPAFLGTCFAYRQPHYFLTAAHCVGTLKPGDLGIYSPFPFAREWQPKAVEVHPEADIAVIRVAEGGATIVPFRDHVANYGFGDDFAAFGFPESIFGPEDRQPTPRLFRGHYQSVMYYVSPFGYHYSAGELSIPAPAGLSGGPLFRPTAPMMLTGMVTENLDSTTYLEAVEEVQTERRVTKTQYQRVVQYGVGVMLARIEEWLDKHAPRPPS
jgi:hypothetical protein